MLKWEADMTMTAEIQRIAGDLLASGQVSCVIGYEVGPRGRTRPAFIYDSEDVGRLVWNQNCTHNLVTYARQKLRTNGQSDEPQRVAVVVKPCDSRAINVLIAEKQFNRDQIHVIGVACEGILEGAGFGKSIEGVIQKRCEQCGERTPVVYDNLVGEPPQVAMTYDVTADPDLAHLEAMTPAERTAFWLSQFDRCIRCYACRQACPMCTCPSCLYERNDSLWVGANIELNEKRTFHLGRAYHLAGRCIGCDECERVCPVDIPIGLLNRKLAKEVQIAFGHRAGLEPVPSPITTILAGEEG
jgi:formate dehydrogenase subunit beta